MPKKYPKFSQQEKDEIIARHRAIVDQFNRKLPDNLKIKYNEEKILERLNDPKEVEIYRISKEIYDKAVKQEKINKELVAKFGDDKPNPNPFARNLSCMYRIDDSREADAFNEKLYKDNMENTNRIGYVRYKKLLQFDPKDLIACGDDKVKLVRFYRDNYTMCKDGFVTGSSLAALKISDELKECLKSFNGYAQIYEYPALIINQARTTDYFACPELTQEQASIILEKEFTYLSKETDLQALVTSVAIDQGVNILVTPKTYFDRFKEIGVEDFSHEYFIRHKPIKTLENGETKEVSWEDYFLRNENHNIQIVERSEEDVDKILQVTSAFKEGMHDVYKDFFKNTAFHSFNGYKDYKVNDYLKKVKPGFWEWLTRKTSPEFKALRTAFKEFNDPRSPNYMNQERLRNAADAYILHKRDQGLENFDEPDSKRCHRLRFAYDIKNALDRLEEQKEEVYRLVDQKLMRGYQNDSGRLFDESDYDYDASIKEEEIERSFQNSIQEALSEDNISIIDTGINHKDKGIDNESEIEIDLNNEDKINEM